MSNSAAHKPSDIEAQYRGETRTGHGYQFWTTSQEDEESIDIREKVERGEVIEKKKPRKRLFAPGVVKRTFIRLASLILIALLAAIGYFVFNYFAVTGASDDAAGDEPTEPVGAIVVLGAAQYNGFPSNVLQERLDHAYNLYADELAPLIITTGGAGRDGNIRDEETEGLVGLIHLLKKDVPESDIVLIPEGANTWEQLSATAFQLEELEIENVVLVSDRYHSYRLLEIADELGIDATLSPSAVRPSIENNLREAAAVSIGRITGYRRLSAFTQE